jgi:replication-associated recombination protein RarA
MSAARRSCLALVSAASGSCDLLKVRALPPEVIGKLVPPELRFRIAMRHATSEFVMPPEVENQCRQMGVRAMKSLYEQYRPTSWGDLTGQDKLTQRLSVLRRRGLVGRVFWLTGDSGTGKTTVARLIANEIADDYAVIEIDAQDMGIDRVREFERMCQFKPLGKGCHVFIVNEAHGLSSKVVSRLQTLLEQDHVQRNSTWIFTTTFQGQQRLFDGAMDACPFMSRAIELTLEHGEDVVLAFAVRARQIAQSEQLDGKPLEDYVQLVRDCGCNMRKVLQRIESGELLA